MEFSTFLQKRPEWVGQNDSSLVYHHVLRLVAAGKTVDPRQVNSQVQKDIETRPTPDDHRTKHHQIAQDEFWRDFSKDETQTTHMTYGRVNLMLNHMFNEGLMPGYVSRFYDTGNWYDDPNTRTTRVYYKEIGWMDTIKSFFGRKRE